MPADIMECPEFQILAQDNKELDPGKREGMIITSFCKLALMANKKP